MSKNKYIIENFSAFLILSGIENIWNTYCTDSLSDETKENYNTFIKSMEKEIALPNGDIDTFQVFAVFNDKKQK